MKNCKEIKRLLSAYADGELSDEERKAVDRHIKTCTECKKALDAHLELQIFAPGWISIPVIE